MTTAISSGLSARRIAPLVGAALLLTLAAVAVVTGSPPLVPLPPPEYSFDLDSPKVLGGLLGAADVLMLGFPDPLPEIPGALLGLPLPPDDLDALSAGNSSVAPMATFVLLFSVDRETVGLAPPAPALVDLGLPYNALDQAERGHAAGDQFMSTTLFARWGRRRGGISANNSLDRNNYDEGGTSFSGDPPAHAGQSVRPVAQDNVDATAWLTGGPPRGPGVSVYFSATAASPSLSSLPGSESPSGAHIFYNMDPLNFTPTELYAAHWMLGLLQSDDIDGLIVFDVDADGMFNGLDQVLFSLTRLSPSLEIIPGASLQGAAADVFVVTPGQPPMLYAAAIELGLGASPDDVDALDFLLCDDALDCVVQHCIRLVRGDWDHDGVIGPLDFDQWPVCMTGPDNGPYAEECEVFDFEPDADIDVADFAEFQLAFTGQ